MESPSGTRLGKLSTSGLPRGRTSKHGHPQEPVRTVPCPENNNKHTPVCDEAAEGKRKGRPKAEEQELRSIPPHMIIQWKEEFKRRSRVKCPCSGCWLEFPSIYGVKYHYQRCQGTTVTERQSHSCPYCEAVFATKVRLQKHKLWNHPDRVTLESRDEQLKLQKTAVKFSSVKRPLENSPPSPMFFKVKKTLEVSTPSHNGELTHQRSDRKQHSQPSLQRHHSQSVQPQFEQSQSTSSDAGGSESEGGSLPPSYADEDPERMKHRRKQKTPKKFTGEQPSISGTFGLKGMNKVEEKLKASRVKRPEGSGFSEDPHRRPTANQSSNKHTAATSSGTVSDVQWQKAISERGEVVCPTCSIVTRKTIHGLKKHMEICQKLQEALKCQQCHKQFRSKAGLNYHTMAEHNSKPSWSEGQMEDEHEERERLRRILKQMGKIKCPSEGCSAHFASLMGYQYHQKRCGREVSDDEKRVFLCQHCGKTYRSKVGRDYHVRTEHSPTITAIMSATCNSKDSSTDTNNNTGKERVASDRLSGGKREQNQPGWYQKAPVAQEKDKVKDKDIQGKDRAKEKAVQNESLAEDFERTPSGRVRRRSAQVAVFHLQEIAEDELAKDWGTKRRIKDDLVPDSKRLNYTRPGLPSFSRELLETWKSQVKENGFICCTNENCDAVYSSVSGLKAHLANCSQGGGGLAKYTCLICQKEFNSESGVKYHISKTHSQNWFRASDSEGISSSKSKPMEDNGIKADVRNGATTGKKRGRKPKERSPVVVALETQTEAPIANEDSLPDMTPFSDSTQSPTQNPDFTDITNPDLNRQPNASTARRSKLNRLPLSE
ncbi:zinc finger protein 512B isoform X1 [Dunckerocampus dactyliophorus]|uniref:zinc finger protein 512B isoform X1 n=1 Tax=Dunckerocampus dactyliophorus TaxID=161453 RepID=UPI0024072166|nr:zinc finger protein 512B isoform X1 [Dunckerocampus dactyliophorus]XP_054610127.1 zinc finger protein 512B isoform X1 [Dunckerocampus dactyliophorus]XP_054610217.1 zinc finger protein 512B isoform X1 [Dunckerocampus dactyliophorus]